MNPMEQFRSSVDRKIIEREVDVLMPPKIAYVLHNRNHGGLQFMLHADTVHSGAWSLVRCGQSAHAGRLRFLRL
jgi:hypothetical protein